MGECNSEPRCSGKTTPESEEPLCKTQAAGPHSEEFGEQPVPGVEEAIKAVTSLTLSQPLDSSTQQGRQAERAESRESQRACVRQSEGESLDEGDNQREGGRLEHMGEEGLSKRRPRNKGRGKWQDPGAGIDKLSRKHAARRKHFERFYKEMSKDDRRRVISTYGYEDVGKSMTEQAIAKLERLFHIQDWTWGDECEKDDYIHNWSSMILTRELARYG